jgi:hypothetical protein
LKGFRHRMPETSVRQFFMGARNAGLHRYMTETWWTSSSDCWSTTPHRATNRILKISPLRLTPPERKKRVPDVQFSSWPVSSSCPSTFFLTQDSFLTLDNDHIVWYLTEHGENPWRSRRCNRLQIPYIHCQV